MKTKSTQQEGCIIDCRVSSHKQSQEGESLDVQLSICRGIANERGWAIVKEWALGFSGRTDTLVFKEQLDFIDKHPRTIKRYVFRAIDRFTRKGSLGYEMMREELSKRGVEMVDSYGIIQPPKNTLEELGFEYGWSVMRPSEITEVVMATTAKQEITNILTRMIGQEIRLTQRGYKIRAPHDGYKNAKIYVEGKKRTIQVPEPERAKYYISMYEMRVSGQFTDQEIVDRINAMGFLTPQFNRWDKSHQRIIGKSGGVPLTVKHFQAIIQRPILCGVVCEKWTNWQPVKAPYDGLVSITTFNAANRGKVFLREDGARLEILYNYNPERVIHRQTRFNPLFPYKMILCPKCEKPFMGSCSRSKSGKRVPAYHCARKHERVGVNKATFDEKVETCVNKLQFRPEVLASIHAVLIDKFRERQGEILQMASSVGHNVADLELEKAELARAFVAATSDVLKKELERQVEGIDRRIKASQGERNKLEIVESDIEDFLRDAKKVMEHPSELLLNPVNAQQQRALFSLVFEGIPNYDEIVAGTPKLAWIFYLSSESTDAESYLVRPRGLEPRTVSLRGSCSTN